MRHITFDESTVLNEFARIAGETGMIKTAAAPDAEQAKKLKDDVLKQLQSIDANLREEPAKKALIEHVQNLMPVGVADVTKAILALFGDPQAPKGSYARMFPKAFAAITTTIKPYQDTAAKARQDSAVAVATPPAKADDGIETQASVKQADSKLYDVSGETGEDLVDSAHPGNAKVSDDVVETIIEQQECDLEVVNKVPKGTYASLVELYNKLHKEGHKEVLADLLDVIKAVATPEDVIAHTLMTLANELDSRGLVKHADAIDSMLSKYADADSAKILRDNIAKQIKALDVERIWITSRDTLAYKIQQIAPTSVTEVSDAIRSIIGDPNDPRGSYARSVEGAYDIVDSSIGQYAGIAQREQQEQANAQKAQQQPAAQQQDNQAAGKQEETDWTKDPEQVKALQIGYNDEYEAVFGKGHRPLKETGKYDKQTAGASNVIFNKAKGWTGLNAYLKRVKKWRAQQLAKQKAEQAAKQQQAPGKETATPPAPPEAPPPPTSMAPSWDDTYKMYRDTFTRTHGPRLLSKNMDDVLKDEAQKLYNIQEQRRTSGQPAYSVDAMRNYISKYIQSLDKNDLLQARI